MLRIRRFWVPRGSDAVSLHRTTKQNSLTEVLQRQYRDNPDAATEYMPYNNWTPEQQTAVKTQPQDGRGGRGGFGPPGGFSGRGNGR